MAPGKPNREGSYSCAHSQSQTAIGSHGNQAQQPASITVTTTTKPSYLALVLEMAKSQFQAS